jgi:hypothetical protein
LSSDRTSTAGRFPDKDSGALSGRAAEIRTGISNVGVSDGDNVPFHARKGTKWDPIVDEEGKRAIDAAVNMKIPFVFFSNFNASKIRNDEDLEIRQDATAPSAITREKREFPSAVRIRTPSRHRSI